METIYRSIVTEAQFKSAIQFGHTAEGLHWDYKSDLNYKKPIDTAKDMCSFANSYGGTLFIGITESMGTNGLKVASGINPQINIEKIKEHLNTVILNSIRPSVNFSSHVLSVDGKPIVCINIEPSIALCGALFNSDTQAFCFPQRTEYGNRYFQFNEIEMRMNNSSPRAVYLKLLEYLNGREQSDITIYPKPLIEQLKRTYLRIIRCNSHEFELGFNSRLIRLPYSMIKEVWNKGNVGEDLCVLLEERIVETEIGENLDIDHYLDREQNAKLHRNSASNKHIKKHGMRSLQ
jgi:hypothetical protein